METLKIDTVPKSDKHSIATNAKPAIIAGLADGKIILNIVSFSDSEWGELKKKYTDNYIPYLKTDSQTYEQLKNKGLNIFSNYKEEEKNYV